MVEHFLDELPVGSKRAAANLPEKKKKRVRRRRRPAAEPAGVQKTPDAPPTDRPSFVDDRFGEPDPDPDVETFNDPELGGPHDPKTSEPESPADDTPVPVAKDKPASPGADDLLPQPSRTKKPPKAATDTTLPTPTSQAAPAEKPLTGSNEAINRRWDEFLLSLNKATLTAVWELGLNSLTEFRRYSREDLMRPRGRLTEGQVNEVEAWLNEQVGIQLAASKASSGCARVRGRGQQLSPGGLRTPARKPSPPLPADATVAQRRHHRLSRNRLTM